MSAMQRRKGGRLEREIIALHKDMGVHAERVPLSGASHYKGGGHDVDVYPFGREEAPLCAEVKGRARGKGFTVLERWLAENDLLYLRRDRAPPLVVMPFSVWTRIVQRLNK